MKDEMVVEMVVDREMNGWKMKRDRRYKDGVLEANEASLSMIFTLV